MTGGGAIARRLSSTTARIAIILLLVQVGSVGATLIAMDRLTDESARRSAQDFALELRADLTDELKRGGIAVAATAVGQRLEVVGDRDAVIALARPDGTMIAGNLMTWPREVAVPSPWQDVELRRIGAQDNVAVGVTAARLPGGYRLLTGQVIEGELRFTRASEVALLAALGLGTLLALFGSVLVARFIATRVSGIAATASMVASGDLSPRVQTDGSGDAFDRLAEAINAMLNRIEALVTELRLVTDALAHDLRSPVSRLKAVIERALQSTRDVNALTALGAAADEADRLLRMLTTALQISRAEAGLGADQFERVDAAQMIADLAEVYGPLAEDNGFAIHVEGPAALPILAHRELLGQALANLVDNALKYARGGSTITLAAQEDAANVLLSVSDNGEGIAPGAYHEALRRYGRLDPSRGTEGAGLGLSLVGTVAHLHGGTMRLEDATPGLRVVIALPRSIDG